MAPLVTPNAWRLAGAAITVAIAAIRQQTEHFQPLPACVVPVDKHKGVLLITSPGFLAPGRSSHQRMLQQEPDLLLQVAPCFRAAWGLRCAI
jgi:hypothetical protein